MLHGRRVVIGTKTGLKVYHCDQHKLEADFKGDQGPTGLAAMFFNAPLMAQVLRGATTEDDNRVAQLIDTKRNTVYEKSKFTEAEKILAIKLTRINLVVATETTITILDVRSMLLKGKIGPLQTNPKGIIAVATGTKPIAVTGEHNFIAYPSSSTTGEVTIYKILDKPELQKIIVAHNTPIAALAFTPAGTLLATSSGKVQ